MRLLFLGLLIITAVGLNAQVAQDAEKVKGLSVGDTIPFFHALTQDSTQFTIKDTLENKPVVLIFYRGQWCPICNRHLSNIQDSLNLIKAKGAQVIAVSPEKPEYGKKMQDKTGADFVLLYDENYEIGLGFKVIFSLDSGTALKYNKLLGANLKEAHTLPDELLPVPATFVISKEGVILWRQLNPNYRIRSNVKDIIENL